MKGKWHVRELVVAIVLTAIVIAWLIAYATAWIVQGQSSLLWPHQTAKSRHVSAQRKLAAGGRATATSKNLAVREA